MRRLHDREAEHRSKKRRGAGGAEQRGEKAVDEGAAVTFATGKRVELRRRAAAERDFKHAEHRHRKDEHERDEADEDARVLKLESEVETSPARFDRDDERGEAEEKSEHARNEREAEPENTPWLFLRLFYEAEDFQRDHRQHARHHVQNKSAEKCRPKFRPQIRGSLCFRRSRISSAYRRLIARRDEPAFAWRIAFHSGEHTLPREIRRAAFHGKGDRPRPVGGDFAQLRMAGFGVLVRRQREKLRFEILRQTDDLDRKFIRLFTMPFHLKRSAIRLRNLRAIFREKLRVFRLRRADGQRERDVRVARHALLCVAHLPRELRLDLDRPGGHLHGRRDFREEQRLAFVHVVQKISRRFVPMRQRPLQRPGFEPWRQLPLDARREADVADELIVNVPVFLDRELHPDRERFPRFDRLRIRNNARRDRARFIPKSAQLRGC